MPSERGEGGIEPKQPLLDSGLFYFFNDKIKKRSAPMSKANPLSPAPSSPLHACRECVVLSRAA